MGAEATTILVIDDDPAVRSSIGFLLKRAGYSPVAAACPEDALALARQLTPHLCLLDMNFSVATTGEEGLELLQTLKRLYPGMPVVLITAWGSIPLAVAGMKSGAADFITKPWNNEHLVQSIKTALDLSSGMLREDRPQKSRIQLNEQYRFDNIIGVDPQLLSVLNIAGRVSETDAAVLILGESGTGKELLAEAIHANSGRKQGPFVKVNLGSIPPTLFESEMFGHKRGAFTDAKHDHVGRFETADGGTIFLDEIGDLDKNAQVKLLRVLQDRSFEAVGTSTTTTVDFRVISATNRNLPDLVAQGQFREDLLYRVNLITLRIPPLRDRRDDIPLLVRYFVDNLRVIYHRDNLRVSPGAVAWLRDLPWPGNVRELKNIVERTILISDHDNLETADFQSQLTPLTRTPGASDLPAVGTVTIDEMEKSMIEKALEFHGRNISEVARSLGLSRGALYRRLDKYGISV